MGTDKNFSHFIFLTKAWTKCFGIWSGKYGIMGKYAIKRSEEKACDYEFVKKPRRIRR